MKNVRLNNGVEMPVPGFGVYQIDDAAAGTSTTESVHRECIEHNFNALSFELSNADMPAVAAPDTGESSFLSHRDPQTVKWLGSMRYDI